jgi:hypothetical protein
MEATPGREEHLLMGYEVQAHKKRVGEASDGGEPKESRGNDKYLSEGEWLNAN